MSQTHWKKLHNPDYLGSYALTPGEDLIATIQVVKNEMVIGPDGKKEECTVIHFIEHNIKPMIINATNAKTIAKLFKTPYIEEWQNKKIQIYSASVKAFGETVDALRIRAFLPQITDAVPKCFDCKKEIEPTGNMNAGQMAGYTQKKYGKPLCVECATKLKQEQSEKKEDVLNENNQNSD